MDKQLERLILLKRLWAFVHSHSIPTEVCSVPAYGPRKQASGNAAL